MKEPTTRISRKQNSVTFSLEDNWFILSVKIACIWLVLFFKVSSDDMRGWSKAKKIVNFSVNLGVSLKTLKDYAFAQVN